MSNRSSSTAADLLAGAGLAALAAGVPAGVEASEVEVGAAEGTAEGAAEAGGGGAATDAAVASIFVPSTMMPVPQCLHVSLTFLPRTFSSGIAYFAEHDVQLTFMKAS